MYIYLQAYIINKRHIVYVCENNIYSCKSNQNPTTKKHNKKQKSTTTKLTHRDRANNQNSRNARKTPIFCLSQLQPIIDLDKQLYKHRITH